MPSWWHQGSSCSVRQPSHTLSHQLAWLMPTIEMFMSSAEMMAWAKASSAGGPSWPGPRASADTLLTLTAVPSMVCGRENLVGVGRGGEAGGELR